MRLFVELLQFVFSIPDVTTFLSNRLSQDPLEKLFRQQRQRGRVNENPNSQDFFKNTQALRVVNSVCNNIKGNCRGNKDITTIEQMPLFISMLNYCFLNFIMMKNFVMTLCTV